MKKKFLLSFMVALSAVLFPLLGCSSIPPKGEFGKSVSYKYGTKNLQHRVKEEGMFFQFDLNISGCEGSTVPVRIFSSSRELLGESEAVPLYESTSWKDFHVFVPLRKMKNLPANFGYALYVVSLEDTDSYIGIAEVPKSNITPSSYLWEFLRLEDDVVRSAGEGFEVEVALSVKGLLGKKADVVLVLNDETGSPLPSPSGGALEIPSYHLEPKWDHTIYEKITFFIPYSLLSHIPSQKQVVLIPSIKANNQIFLGNLRIQFWAGGSPERQLNHLKKSAEDVEEKIQYYEKRLKILEQEENK